MSKELENTLEERAKTHGNWEENSELIQKIKKMIRQYYGNLEYPSREALEMIVHKMCRILCGDSTEPDHWQDIAGYAMLKYYRLTREKKEE